MDIWREIILLSFGCIANWQGLVWTGIILQSCKRDMDLMTMASRSKPMKLIVGGAPRTGTNSIIAALKELGFTPYEYPTRLSRGELGWWASQLQAKYDTPDTELVLDREKLDRMTGEYDCICDAPCFHMVGELAKAFPEAKILLNERDVDAWLNSVRKTLRPSFEEDQRWTSIPLKFLDPTLARPIMLCDEANAAVLCDYDYSDVKKLKARFHTLYENIHTKVDSSRLLKFKVQDGWRPLCDFLDVECPPKEKLFPRVNDATELIDSGNNSWVASWSNSVRNIAFGLVIIVGMWWIVRI